jgi:N-acetylglucosaminyldiphosphoundecaprenol N-acetyl-beta-D-mannosaminyltransferase
LERHGEPIDVWGLPLMPYTMADTLDRIDRLITARVPSYFITANLNYAMLCDSRPALRSLNDGAAFLVADGMPLVWATKFRRRKLPERVAGSDLIYAMCERAALRGHRVYLLGAAPGIADEAARRLTDKYPGLQIVGVECPPFRDLTPEELDAQTLRIRSAKPDILIAAFGQPKGEEWVAANGARLGVPVAVQVGASLDFVAGKVKRAPKWMRRTGLEWTFRFLQEPRRLGGRYARNILFLGKMMFRRSRAN